MPWVALVEGPHALFYEPTKLLPSGTLSRRMELVRKLTRVVFIGNAAGAEAGRNLIPSASRSMRWDAVWGRH